MATVSLFRGTNMAAVTSCENQELCCVEALRDNVQWMFSDLLIKGFALMLFVFLFDCKSFTLVNIGHCRSF